MKTVSYGDIEKMLFGGAEMRISEEDLRDVEACHEFLRKSYTA